MIMIINQYILSKSSINYAIILAEAVLILMEYVSNGPRYPYLFINGNTGLPITQFMNTLIPIPLTAIYTMPLSTLIFTAIFSITLYYAIIRRFLAEE